MNADRLEKVKEAIKLLQEIRDAEQLEWCEFDKKLDAQPGYEGRTAEQEYVALVDAATDCDSWLGALDNSIRELKYEFPVEDAKAEVPEK